MVFDVHLDEPGFPDAAVSTQPDGLMMVIVSGYRIRDVQGLFVPLTIAGCEEGHFLREGDPGLVVLQERSFQVANPLFFAKVDDQFQVRALITLPSAFSPFHVAMQAIDQCISPAGRVLWMDR